MSGAEPLAALGLACNVFQVVSFASEVCKATKMFYELGALDPACARAAQSLTRVYAEIETNTMSRPLTPAEQEAVRIAKDCREAVMALMPEVNRQTASGTKGSPAKALVAGFKSAIKPRLRQVGKLEKQLAAHQKALETRLLFNLWYVHLVGTVRELGA